MTSFTDLHIRADSEQQANDLLAQAELHTHIVDDDYEGFSPAEGVNIDTIGLIFEGGEYDEEGEEISPPVQVDGWHINLRLREPLSEEQETVLGPILIDCPNKPVRMWG